MAIQKSIMEKVGALSVRCGCSNHLPICSACLLADSILYLADSEISSDIAIREGLRCCLCGKLLAKSEDKENKDKA